jgi:hypothetical protein
VEQNDLTMRPIAGRGELGLFCRLPCVLNEELAGDLAAGRRRPGWMRVALRGDRLLARVGWRGRTGDGTPFLLDIFDIDDSSADRGCADTGVRLLRTALAEVVPAGTRPPGYLRNVPPGWREDEVTRRVVEDRMGALERAGARLLVERLRFEWRPGAPVPGPRGRLVFRPVRDTGEILALMTLVLDGTLDAHSRDDLTRMPAREAAVRHYEGELAHYRSPRDWWRIATLPDGEPAGFVTPARNDYNPIIRAATDLASTPMANAFQRAGYVNFERKINMTWR